MVTRPGRGRAPRAAIATGSAGLLVSALLLAGGPAAATDDIAVPAIRGGTVAVAAGKTGKPEKPCPNAGKPATPSQLGPSVPAGQLGAGLQEGAAEGHCRFDYTAVLGTVLPAVPSGSTLTSARLRVTVSAVARPVELALFATSTEVPDGTLLAASSPAVESPATTATATAPGAVTLDALPAVEAMLRGEAGALAIAGSPARALLAAPGGANAPALDLTYTRTEPDDTEAPTVSITSPTFGETVFGTVPVTVRADDNVGVASVTVSVGGRLVGTDDTAPFEVRVDTTQLPNGEQPLAVEAVDRAGNSDRDLLPVVVDNRGGPLHHLDLDFAAGRIDVDTYVLQGLTAVLSQPGLDPRYAGRLPDEVSAWTWTVLQHLPETSAVTRQRVETLLTPVDRVATGAVARSTALPAPTGALVGTSAPSRLDGVDCHALRGFLNLGYDCVGRVGSVDLRWASGDFSDPKGTVPAQVEAAAKGLGNAQRQFDAQGWRPIGYTEAFMAQGLVDQRAISLPNGVVMLNRDDGDLAATAGHELFHQYEYEYLQVLDLRSPERLSDIGWLLEASAEWASHQLVAEYPDDYNDGDKSEYLRNVELLLNDPTRNLMAWDSGSNRQYGAFPVLEWLHATDGRDAVRSLWTEVDDSGDARAALRRAVGNRLDLMWRDLYFLDVDVPGRVDRSVTDRWRAELADTVGDAPYDSATGNRPVETVLSMGEGDSTAEPLSLEAGGATFIELDLDLDRRSIVRLSPSMSAGNVTVDPQALTAYDLDPASGPDTCALPANDGGDQVIDFDPAVCDGLSIVVSNTSLDDPASGTLGIEVGDRVDTTITNGLIRLGVHAEGHLDVPGFDASSGTGTTTVGLRWQPTNADALAPGCACEGWGVADLDHGVGGWANASWGGTQDLDLRSADFDASSGTSVVGAGVGSPFLVTHEFEVAQESANLFAVHVTIKNNTTALGYLLGLYDHYGPLTPTYRRVMDWDVEPTAFSEFVTIGARGGKLPPEVVNATNDGFASPDPRDPATDLGARGLFTDFGPQDHGALFDLRLPEIDPGESATFTMYYGGGATTAMAQDALDLVGADVWSLAEPDVVDGATLGAPNTFAFGVRFDRPVQALARSGAPAAGPADPTTTDPAPRRDGVVRQ